MVQCRCRCCPRASGPVDCESLKNKVMLECDRTEERIMNTWFPKVIHLVNSKEMMQGVRAKKLPHFSNSLCTLISNQVRASPIGNRDIEVTQIGPVISSF